MARKAERIRQVALLFVEGDTEEEFYKCLLTRYLANAPKAVINLHGNSNIHRKILSGADVFLQKHKDCSVRIYCCIDREGRDHNPPLDIVALRDSLRADRDFSRVLSADAIVATQMIESWYFHDIEGIFKFLKVPRSERNPAKFTPPEKFTHIHLARLFERYGKVYIKGRKSANFINNLDLAKIHAGCAELRNGLELIVRQAGTWERVLVEGRLSSLL